MNQPKYLTEQIAESNTAPDRQLNRPRKSGFVFQPLDAQAASKTLRLMAEEANPEECQETLAYLMKALNETRAAGDERILFPEVAPYE